MSFRPLIGVSFCKHYGWTNLDSARVNVSVPLSGLASVNVFNGDFLWSCILVSVPLSGLASVNGARSILVFSYVCFRPLIGVSFCKQ